MNCRQNLSQLFVKRTDYLSIHGESLPLESDPSAERANWDLNSSLICCEIGISACAKTRSRLRRGRTANKGQRRRSSHPFTTLVAPVYPLLAAPREPMAAGATQGRQGAPARDLAQRLWGRSPEGRKSDRISAPRINVPTPVQTRPRGQMTAGAHPHGGSADSASPMAGMLAWTTSYRSGATGLAPSRRLAASTSRPSFRRSGPESTHFCRFRPRFHPLLDPPATDRPDSTHLSRSPPPASVNTLPSPIVRGIGAAGWTWPAPTTPSR